MCRQTCLYFIHISYIIFVLVSVVVFAVDDCDDDDEHSVEANTIL